MSSSYDAIVIGAGLGGLSAATLLALHERRVLLLERNNTPGGYATSFVRGRYEFEAALHELSGIGSQAEPGPLALYLDELGVLEKIDLVRMDTLFRAVLPGIDVTLPPGIDAFEDAVCDAFPTEARGVRRFLGRVFGLGRDLAKIFKNRGAGHPALMPLRYPHFFRYVPNSWGNVLRRDVADPRARAVLSQYWGYAGLPPSRVAFLNLAATVNQFVTHGAAFPMGRSAALSFAFLDRLTELGGEVRLRCGADRILTRAGRVHGVVTEQGDEVTAPIVLTSTDPIRTCRDLLDTDEGVNGLLGTLRYSEPAASTVNVYLGLARPPGDLGIADHEVFIAQGLDLDDHHANAHTLDNPGEIAATCYNIIHSDLAAPDTTVLKLSALKYGAPWYDLDPAIYQETKQRLAEVMIGQAEALWPGLRAAAEVVEVSTPMTNMRYTGALGGSIYGFDQTPWDNMVWRMPHQGPVDGLHFVGAWTQPGGGFQPVIMSGRISAGMLLLQAGAGGS